MTQWDYASHPKVSRGLGTATCTKAKNDARGPDVVLFADRFLGRGNGRSAAFRVTALSAGIGSDAVAA